MMTKRQVCCFWASAFATHTQQAHPQRLLHSPHRGCCRNLLREAALMSWHQAISSQVEHGEDLPYSSRRSEASLLWRAGTNFAPGPNKSKKNDRPTVYVLLDSGWLVGLPALYSIATDHVHLSRCNRTESSTVPFPALMNSNSIVE